MLCRAPRLIPKRMEYSQSHLSLRALAEALQHPRYRLAPLVVVESDGVAPRPDAVLAGPNGPAILHADRELLSGEPGAELLDRQSQYLGDPFCAGPGWRPSSSPPKGRLDDYFRVGNGTAPSPQFTTLIPQPVKALEKTSL